MKPYEQLMIREMSLRNFADGTQALYLRAVNKLVKYFGRDADQVSSEEIKSYMLYLRNDCKLADSTIACHQNAFTFFVNEALQRTNDPFRILRRRRERPLPEILTKDEIRRLIACANNLRRKTLLMTAYSSGLRISELMNLQVQDIDSNRMVLHVRCGKGKKDRYTLLTPALLDQLRAYYRQYRPTSYLFYTKTKDAPSSVFIATAAFRKARRKAGIKKGRGIHTLRHCFATHLLEAGVDLRTIQLLMGHTSIATTSAYLRLTDKKLQTANVAVDLLKHF